MPQLPRKNSLDYNPDATVAASKKLTAIALERMKNPLEDPDQATLSTLNAQRNLGESVSSLEELAGQYHSLVLRMGNLLLGNIKFVGDWDGMGRKGKKKGGAREETFLTSMYPLSVSSSSSSSVRSDEYRRRLAADRGRFRQFYDDDSRNSTATPASSRGVPIYPYDDPSETYIDDDDNSTLPSRPSTVYDDGIPDIDPDAPFAPVAKRASEDRSGATFNSLIFPLIQVTRRMNILINSKIKPAISALSSSQIKRMNDIYQMVSTSYNDVVRPQNRRDFRMGFEGRKDPFTGQVYRPNAYLQESFGNNSLEQQLIQFNQFGDEMLGTWDIERKNLLLNLTVVINSWKQNTPTGQQTAFNEDITRSFQQTASRLGKKAELVDSLQRGVGYPDVNKLVGEAEDLESVGDNFKNINQGIPYEPIPDDRVIQELRQYDKKGNLIGQGRKVRGRPKKDTMTMTLVGSGRNFYGEQIDNSRDIPTIWRSYKDCPTKYLL